MQQVKHKYEEGESVEYHCELEGLTLIGGASRKCLNGKWTGTIPRCGKYLILIWFFLTMLKYEKVQELEYQAINFIDIEVTVENKNMVNNLTYHYEYKANGCIESSQMTSPHMWTIHLTQPQRHISYIEISVLNKYNKLTTDQIKDIINFVRVSSMVKM